MLSGVGYAVRAGVGLLVGVALRGLRGLGLPAGTAAAAAQLDPAAAQRRAASRTTSVPSSSVPGFSTARAAAAARAARPRRGRPRAAPRRRGRARARPASRGAARRPAGGSRRREGWNWSGPKSSAGAAANSGPRIEPSETVRPPASTTAIVCAAASRRDHERATCLSGGAIGLMVPRSGQVPTRTSTPASRRRRTPSERCRTDCDGRDRVGDVVGADEDDRDVGVGRAAPRRPGWPGRWTGRRRRRRSRRWTRRWACVATPLASWAPGVSSTRSTP